MTNTGSRSGAQDLRAVTRQAEPTTRWALSYRQLGSCVAAVAATARRFRANPALTSEGAPMEETARRAAAAMARYNRRRDRLEEPAGRRDRDGCWYPGPREEAAMPWASRPDRVQPYAYLHACRTLQACAALEGVGLSKVKALQRKLRDACTDPDRAYCAADIIAAVEPLAATARPTLATRRIHVCPSIKPTGTP